MGFCNIEGLPRFDSAPTHAYHNPLCITPCQYDPLPRQSPLMPIPHIPRLILSPGSAPYQHNILLHIFPSTTYNHHHQRSYLCHLATHIGYTFPHFSSPSHNYTFPLAKTPQVHISFHQHPYNFTSLHSNTIELHICFRSKAQLHITS